MKYEIYHSFEAESDEAALCRFRELKEDESLAWDHLRMVEVQTERVIRNIRKASNEVQLQEEGYSTIADFKLIANGTTYDVGQVSSNFIIMAHPVEIPPCEAELIITVEGDERRRQVRLPNGASSDSDWVVITRISDEEELVKTILVLELDIGNYPADMNEPEDFEESLYQSDHIIQDRDWETCDNNPI